MHEIVLGLANLNNKYGKLKNNLSNKEFKKIILKKKKTLVDTAILYKNNSYILRRNKDKIKIISKLPNLDLRKNLSHQIHKYFFNHLKKIGLKKIDTLLLHYPDQLFQKNGNQIYLILTELKKKKFVDNIGYSLYEDKNLISMVKNFKPDVIQFPLNILNTRFTSKKNINFLKQNNIRLQVRSIFLQGILLNLNKLNHEFSFLKKYSKKIEKFSHKNNISVMDCCINFIKNQKYIDQIIIGCNSATQYDAIIKSIKGNKTSYPKLNLLRKELRQIDPRKWK
mgnify:CR=1 FL=1